MRLRLNRRTDLRVTPAMETGITSCVWKLSELLK